MGPYAKGGKTGWRIQRRKRALIGSSAVLPPDHKCPLPPKKSHSAHFAHRKKKSLRVTAVRSECLRFLFPVYIRSCFTMESYQGSREGNHESLDHFDSSLFLLRFPDPPPTPCGLHRFRSLRSAMAAGSHRIRGGPSLSRSSGASLSSSSSSSSNRPLFRIAPTILGRPPTISKFPSNSSRSSSSSSSSSFSFSSRRSGGGGPHHHREIVRRQRTSTVLSSGGGTRHVLYTDPWATSSSPSDSGVISQLLNRSSSSSSSSSTPPRIVLSSTAWTVSPEERARRRANPPSGESWWKRKRVAREERNKEGGRGSRRSSAATGNMSVGILGPHQGANMKVFETCC